MPPVAFDRHHSACRPSKLLSGRTRGVLAESVDQAHLIEAMDAVMRRLGGTARIWRTDRLATVIVPGSRDLQASFAPVAKHYGAVVEPCPPRRRNRKGAVESAVRCVSWRWWRTMTATTLEEAQVSLDRFLAGPGDARTRAIPVTTPEGELSVVVRADIHSPDGIRVRATVGELADAEPLLALPALAFPATMEVTRIVAASATVAFRGNRYSTPPGLGGSELTVRHRLNSGTVEIHSPAGTCSSPIGWRRPGRERSCAPPRTVAPSRPLSCPRSPPLGRVTAKPTGHPGSLRSPRRPVSSGPKAPTSSSTSPATPS